MAFNPERLALVVEPIGGVGLRWFNYQTDESEDDLIAADYLPDAEKYGLRAYDLIFVSPASGTEEPYILTVDSIDAAGNATLVNSSRFGSDTLSYRDKAAVGLIRVPAATDNILVSAYDATVNPSAGRANYRAASDADYAATPALLRLTDAAGRKFVINENSVDVLMAGADASGVVDSSAAFQAVADFYKAKAGGGNIIVPAGSYRLNETLTIDLSAGTTYYTPRVNIIGAGSGVCRIFSKKSNGNAIRVIGGVWGTGGTGLRFLMQGIWLEGETPNPASAQTGISVENCQGMVLSDVVVIQYWLGVTLKNIVIAKFDNCLITFCNYGMITDGALTVNSPVNEVIFSGTHVTANRQYGIHFNRSTNITFIGGSFEGNGLPGAWTSDIDRWCIRLTNCGWNGGHVLGCYGTHFESNSGKASIWIEHQQVPGIYNIDADFVRNGTGTDFITNEILFETTGATQAVVNVRSAFSGVNGYVPSASRRYIGLGSVTGVLHRINYQSSLFESQTEIPTFLDATENQGGRTVFTPVVTAVTGALTTSTPTMRYRKVGREVYYTLQINITTNGTAATALDVTLPFAAEATLAFVANGVEVTAYKSLSGRAIGSSMRITNYDGTYPGGDSKTLIMQGVYETAA